MPVNEHLTSYSLTATNNTPAGSSPVGADLDDHLRDIKKNAYKASLANTLAKSAGYEATVSDHGSIILADATAGTVTISIGAASSLFNGWRVGVACVSSTNGATLDPNAAETVDGTASISIAAGQVRWVVCDGSNFRTYAAHVPLSAAAVGTLKDATSTASLGLALGVSAEVSLDKIVSGTALRDIRYNSSGVVAEVAPETEVVTVGSISAVSLVLNSVFEDGYDYKLQISNLKNIHGTGKGLRCAFYQGASQVAADYRVAYLSVTSSGATGAAAGATGAPRFTGFDIDASNLSGFAEMEIHNPGAPQRLTVETKVGQSSTAGGAKWGNGVITAETEQSVNGVAVFLEVSGSLVSSASATFTGAFMLTKHRRTKVA